MMTPTDDLVRPAHAGDSAAGPPDFECLDAEPVPGAQPGLGDGNRPLALLAYAAIGAGLGAVFVQSEVVSWFRIQEMFRFQSVHMYGIIGSAIAVAALSVWLLQRLGVTTLHGEPIRLPPKTWGEGRVPGARYWMGGTVFGLGWALLGACPGPIFALFGVGLASPATGLSVMAVAFLAAMAGTWAYALIRHRLPH